MHACNMAVIHQGQIDPAPSDKGLGAWFRASRKLPQRSRVSTNKVPEGSPCSLEFVRMIINVNHHRLHLLRWLLKPDSPEQNLQDMKLSSLS